MLACEQASGEGGKKTVDERETEDCKTGERV